MGRPRVRRGHGSGRAARTAEVASRLRPTRRELDRPAHARRGADAQHGPGRSNGRDGVRRGWRHGGRDRAHLEHRREGDRSRAPAGSWGRRSRSRYAARVVGDGDARRGAGPPGAPRAGRRSAGGGRHRHERCAVHPDGAGRCDVSEVRRRGRRPRAATHRRGCGRHRCGVDRRCRGPRPPARRGGRRARLPPPGGHRDGAGVLRRRPGRRRGGRAVPPGPSPSGVDGPLGDCDRRHRSVPHCSARAERLRRSARGQRSRDRRRDDGDRLPARWTYVRTKRRSVASFLAHPLDRVAVVQRRRSAALGRGGDGRGRRPHRARERDHRGDRRVDRWIRGHARGAPAGRPGGRAREQLGEGGRGWRSASRRAVATSSAISMRTATSTRRSSTGSCGRWVRASGARRDPAAIR